MNYECSSLSIDISKRNKIYIPDKIDIFLGCSFDISKRKVNHVINKNGTFGER